MEVYKFGGGILKDVRAIQLMSDIVSTRVAESDSSGFIVIVSAFNKMTNAFEEAFGSIRQGRKNSLNQIRKYHHELISDLFTQPEQIWTEEIEPLFERMEDGVLQVKKMPYRQGYDQLVSFGEILSSTIISAYWKQEGLRHQVMDARELIVTDNQYQAAKVDWESTTRNINAAMASYRQAEINDNPSPLFLTQGFIGGTPDGNTTTLGREGSDYSAAIFGAAVDASAVTVWKDVPGVLNVDPTEFPDPKKMDEISYLEAVELSYFGAKVIHPNTIKPLQNRQIPLYVKSLFEPEAAGTVIIDRAAKAVGMPVVIRKRQQVLVSVQPRDFSFIMEDAMADIFNLLATNSIRVNLMQHGAVSISVVFNQEQVKLDQLLDALLPKYKVLYNSDLELLTIRHYTQGSISKYTANRRIYVQQQSRRTARFVLG